MKGMNHKSILHEKKTNSAVSDYDVIVFSFAHDAELIFSFTSETYLVVQINIVIVITFYSTSCLGQETVKGPFGLRVKLPPAHLSTTHGGGFTLSLLVLNVKQESCEYQFL